MTGNGDGAAKIMLDGDGAAHIGRGKDDATKY